MSSQRPTPGSQAELTAKMGVHTKKRHKHRKRPCGNPPGLIPNLVLTFKEIEGEHARHFSGKIKHDRVEEDEQGHGTTIDRYEYQIKAVDADGDPVEIEDERTRFRFKRRSPHRVVKIAEITNPSGNTYRIRTERAHGFVVNDEVEVTGADPNQYNGEWTVDTVVNPNTIEVTGSNSGLDDATINGFLHDNIEGPKLQLVIFNKVPHPRFWYWTIRGRAKDDSGCWGDWTDWTEPVLPYATLRPPYPLDVKHEAAHDRIHIQCHDPLADIERRGTVTATSGASGLTGVKTHFEGDVEAGMRIKVGGEIKEVKRINSDTSLNIIGTWSSTHTAVPWYLRDRDPDVWGYLYQIALADDVDIDQTPNEWNAVYDSAFTKRNHFAFRIPEADEDEAFYSRVISLSHERTHSRPVMARRSVNSDPDADGQKVRMLRDRVVKSFTIPNLVTPGDYPQPWRADRDYRFKRIMADVGYPDGTPSGGSCKANVRRRLADLSAEAPVLNSDNVLDIDPGDYHDQTTGDDLSDFNITALDKNERLTIKVIESNGASDLVVTVVLIPRDVEDD